MVLLLFFNCLLSPVSLNLENSSCAKHGGGYGRFSLRFYARCALIWRRRVSPPLCHSFHFTCEEGGRLEKGLVGWGEKREGGGPSLSRRVSWLLCIQQQLWVNAWTHGGTAPSGTACSDHSSLGAGFFSLAHERSCRLGFRGGILKLCLFIRTPGCKSVGWSPRKGLGSVSPPLFSLSLSPSFPLRVRIVNDRNKLISAQRVKLAAARLASPHHGCKVLSVCWWEFYSRRTAEYGFCPLFGLLQLQ